MMDFITWFIGVLPDFLLTPPISVFTAFAIMFVVGRLVKQMMHL